MPNVKNVRVNVFFFLQFNQGDLQYHETRIASSGPVSLAETGAVQASKGMQCLLHLLLALNLFNRN